MLRASLARLDSYWLDFSCLLYENPTTFFNLVQHENKLLPKKKKMPPKRDFFRRKFCKLNLGRVCQDMHLNRWVLAWPGLAWPSSPRAAPKLVRRPMRHFAAFAQSAPLVDGDTIESGARLTGRQQHNGAKEMALKPWGLDGATCCCWRRALDGAIACAGHQSNGKIPPEARWLGFSRAPICPPPPHFVEPSLSCHRGGSKATSGLICQRERRGSLAPNRKHETGEFERVSNWLAAKRVWPNLEGAARTFWEPGKWPTSAPCCGDHFHWGRRAAESARARLSLVESGLG